VLKPFPSSIAAIRTGSWILKTTYKISFLAMNVRAGTSNLLQLESSPAEKTEEAYQ